MNGLIVNAMKSAGQTFQEEGVLLYPQLLAGEELARLREACEFVLEQQFDDIDRNRPKAKNTKSMAHLNDSRWHRETREHWKVIMETVADPRLLGPVEQIFGGRSLFRSTQLFFNPRFESSEGDWHRDNQFLLPDEDAVRAQLQEMKMPGLQLQLALIDNSDVEYVPFSAGRYDSPEEYYYRCADGRSHKQEAGMPNAMRIHQRAGDALIFNPFGLHRGRYHVDKPRRTFMATYTPADQIVNDSWSQQTWMSAPGHLDGLSKRAAAYFEEFIETYQPYWTQL
jgi:hypothetical protein